MHYNIALIPQTKSHEFIQLANTFSFLANNYLLGPRSLPHVTLCQFYAETNEIDILWQKVCAALLPSPIELLFTEWSFVTINSLFWVSLLPSTRDFRGQVPLMSTLIKQMIKQSAHKWHLTPSSYDPHLTLLNTKQKDYKNTVTSLQTNPIHIIDTFQVCLGRSDEVGQLIEIVK